MNKYEERKRREFLEFIIQERNKTEETLKGLREKVIGYLFEGGNLQASKAWKYVTGQVEWMNEKRIYINKLLSGKELKCRLNC
jgi:intein/homing endonuclease